MISTALSAKSLLMLCGDIPAWLSCRHCLFLNAVRGPKNRYVKPVAASLLPFSVSAPGIPESSTMATADHTQRIFHRAFSNLGSDQSLVVVCQEGPFSLGLGGNFSASFNLLSSGETQHVLLLDQAVSAVLSGVWCWEAGRKWSLRVNAVSHVTSTDLCLCKYLLAAVWLH